MVYGILKPSLGDNSAGRNFFLLLHHERWLPPSTRFLLNFLGDFLLDDHLEVLVVGVDGLSQHLLSLLLLDDECLSGVLVPGGLGPGQQHGNVGSVLTLLSLYVLQ